MEKSVGKEANLFELMPRTGEDHGVVLNKKRIMIGSSNACDVQISQSDVSSIHAILEISDKGFRLFDMNSKNGSYVNGQKHIVSEFKVGDTLTFGRQEYDFRKYDRADHPPVLDMLHSALPPKISKPSKAKPSLPSQSPIADREEMPRVEYPLAQDPKAEFSEYIFEDVDTLYPIFNYSVDRGTVEVIILFKERVYSVDFLPSKNGTYKFVGSRPNEKEIEYAYLGKEEKVDFVKVENEAVTVFPLFGYDVLSLTDEKSGPSNETAPIILRLDDIIRFEKGDIKIFVRQTDSPPNVAPAPVFRRDKDFQKYLLLMFCLVFAFMGSMSFLEIDEELEKEKVPERIATILYKKKLVVSKKKAIDKTKKQPVKVVQKSPKQIVEKKPQQKKDTKPVKTTKTTSSKAGDKSATKTGLIKKVSANKGPDNKKTNNVRPTVNQQQGGKDSRLQATRASTRVANSKGQVDTYKSFDFKSTVNSLLTKGGSTRSAKAASTASSSTVRDNSSALGGESATIRRAQVSKNVGSLVGATDGKLDTSKGVAGLVKKKAMFFAGLPYKTVHLGGMDPDIIRRILLDHLSQFRHCYQKELDRATSSFNGVVKLDFIIGASGHVTRAGVDTVSSSLPSSVKGCVVNILKGIRFPEPMGGGVVEVSQPMNFYPRRG